MTTAPSTQKLERDKLMDNVKSLLKLSQDISEQEFSKIIAGEITNADFKELSIQELKLRDLADDLTINIFTSIQTDIKEPAQKIAQTIQKINEAILDLAEINKILQILGKLINLFTTVTLAISTGNIALIANILDQIQALL